ncbi:TPA: hypothetical protein ACH3X1_015773 [Trebouxia sp. C0004]
MATDRDTGTKRLLELGIRQQLRRPLHWTQNCMICCCIMSPITGITGLYSQGLTYGGPVVLIWGWVVVALGNILAGLAMSELCSAFPVSGGLYFWSFMLAGKHGPFASWLVGWINLFGQVALVAGAGYTIVQAFAAVLFLATLDNRYGYYPGNSMQVYIFGGLLTIGAIINSSPLRTVAYVAKVGTVWNAVGCFIMALIMLVVAPKQQRWSWVLTNFEANPASGIQSNVYTCLIGTLAASWAFIGYDSVAHLMEETKSADATAGRPMVYAIGITCIVGFAYILVLTLCMQNVGDIAAPSGDLAQVNGIALIFWGIFKARFGSGIGGVALMIIPLGCACFCALLSLTSASRMLYGFSRDRAAPFWWLWQTLDSEGVPVHAVWGMTFGAFLMGLPILAGTAAFAACTSISTAGLSLAYGLPIGIRLVYAQNYFEPGPFALGRWSTTISLTAFLWLMFTSILFMFPLVYPITSQNFNYASVAVISILLASLGVWLISAQSWFGGPRLDVDNSDAVRTKYWVTDPPRRTFS